jgi:hypothetical protein
MDYFIGRSRIMVLASHSDTMIKAICNKGALMQEGRIVTIGPVEEVLDEYHFMVHGSRPTKVTPTTEPMVEVPPTEPLVEVPPAPPPPIYSEETIREVGLTDRLTRTNGAIRITKLVAKDENNRIRWTYLRGETVAFYLEYEVLEPVADLALQFRLYIDASEGYPTQTLAEIFEVISSEGVESGHHGEIEIMLPQLKLQPNQILLFAHLGTTDDKLSYDVVDSNVALPPLVIRARGPQKGQRGIVALDYVVKGIERDKFGGESLVRSHL